MGHYVLLDQIQLLKEEFKCLLVVSGLECVMMDGMIVKLVWSVDNWDLDHQGQLATFKLQKVNKWYLLTFPALEMNRCY